MTVDIEQQLAGLDHVWQATEAEGNGRAELPEGDYEAQVLGFDYAQKSNGELRLQTKLQITEGEYSGTTTDTWNTLSDPKHLGKTKAFLELLGITDVRPFNTLPERLRSARGVRVGIRVAVKKRGEKSYTNVYVNELIPHRSDESEEDIPF